MYVNAADTENDASYIIMPWGYAHTYTVSIISHFKRSSQDQTLNFEKLHHKTIRFINSIVYIDFMLRM